MLLLPTAVFQVDAARSGIANYLISSFPQFAEIQYDSYDNAKPPFGWSSPYYPAWLPEGSKVTKVLMESQGDFVWYEDSKNHEFQFTVLTETIQGPSFDEEDMESEKVDINGHSATLFYTKDRRIHSLVIPKLDTILIITGEISADEVMKIGESINLDEIIAIKFSIKIRSRIYENIQLNVVNERCVMELFVVIRNNQCVKITVQIVCSVRI